MAVVERKKIMLDGTETWRSLRDRGLPDTSARRALKRGWYIEGWCMQGGIRPTPEGPGHFNEIGDNPYYFATKWVVVAMNEMSASEWLWTNLEDYIQNAVMELWENRHADARKWPKLAAKIVIRKTKRMLVKDIDRANRESETESMAA